MRNARLAEPPLEYFPAEREPESNSSAARPRRLRPGLPSVHSRLPIPFYAGPLAGSIPLIACSSGDNSHLPKPPGPRVVRDDLRACPPSAASCSPGMFDDTGSVSTSTAASPLLPQVRAQHRAKRACWSAAARRRARRIHHRRPIGGLGLGFSGLLYFLFHRDDLRLVLPQSSTAHAVAVASYPGQVLPATGLRRPRRCRGRRSGPTR